MVFVYIVFVWTIVMIIWFGFKWAKEKKESMTISPEGMKKYVGRHKK